LFEYSKAIKIKLNGILNLKTTVFVFKFHCFVSEKHFIKTERYNNLETNRISWKIKQIMQHM